MNEIYRLMSELKFKSLKNVFLNLKDYRYAIVKGEPLSLYAYNKLGERVSTDIDILISRDNLKDIERILESNGLVCLEGTREDKLMLLANSHQVFPWKRQIMGDRLAAEVDLNFDVFWGEYSGKRIDMSEFLSDTIEVDIYGVKVKTLSPLKAMVQLILHHYKDMNSIYRLASCNSINYKMFEDVYYLWKSNQTDITLDKLYYISSEYEILPYVYYVLHFTNEIFKDLELTHYIEEFRTETGDMLLDCYGLTDKERKTWKVRFDTRLETENMFDLIKEDLTEEDFKKIEYNKKIFG